MQSMLRSFFLSAVLLPISILADAKVWEPLTNETLVGTWEAVMPIESTMVAGLYHMEIRKDSESYLVGMITAPNEPAWERFVFRVTASEVNDGKVTLHFRGKYEGKEAEVVFDGSGAGLTEQGAIGGKFRYMNGQAFDGFSGEIWFKKGAWTREFDRTSKEAEKLIRSLRSGGKK